MPPVARRGLVFCPEISRGCGGWPPLRQRLRPHQLFVIPGDVAGGLADLEMPVAADLGDRGHLSGRAGQETFLEALRSEEHTSELQSRENLVCRLLLEKKKKNNHTY